MVTARNSYSWFLKYTWLITDDDNDDDEDDFAYKLCVCLQSTNTAMVISF
jgi:hypothetical protein